jgi:hypothetical protein
MKAWIETDYGAKLRVLDTLREGECVSDESEGKLCTVLFPALEGQHSGTWTFIAQKESGEPAEVSVTVRFERVSS